MSTYTDHILTVAQFRSYARIELTTEDTLIQGLIEEAVGELEDLIGQPLYQREVTWYDDAQTLVLWSGVQNLILRSTPIDPDTVTVNDVDGEAVSPDNYMVRQDRGLLMGLGGDSAAPVVGGFIFDNGPYTIACTAGYGTSPDWADKYQPAIRRLVTDMTAYYYQQRTPGASSENAAGASVSYQLDPDLNVPAPVARGIKRLKGPIIGR